jgi:hypothetical protein
MIQNNDNDARLASVVANRARESEPLALLCFVFLILFAAARVPARCVASIVGAAYPEQLQTCALTVYAPLYT